MIRVFAVLAALLHSATAAAQEFPVKPIRLIVGFGAGGTTDLLARVVGDALAKSLGQPVVVENRPGAAGVVAAEHVASQPADGYTIMFSGVNFTYFPIFNANWKLDLLNSFSYLGTVSDGFSAMLVMPAQFPPRNLAELIDYGRKNPGRLNYARVGPGPWDMAVQHISKTYGLGITFVPYKSQAEAKTAAQRGDVHIWLDGLTGLGNDLKEGRARILAVLGPQRIPGLDAPTLTEAGIANPRFEPASWWGLVGPANIPADVSGKLSKGIAEATRSPELAGRIKVTGSGVARFGTPAEHRNVVATDLAFYSKLARELGIRPE